MARPRLLVAYSNEGTFVTTTMEYLSSFKLYSRFAVSYVHVTHGAEIDFDLNTFDAVFNSYCARLCFEGYVSKSYREALKRFRGVRLIAVQDEYDQTNVLQGAIQDLQFDVVFTCVPQEGRNYVYPAALFPDTKFVTVLTGYVPAELKQRRRSSIPLAERPILIGYRGRSLPVRYGRLGFEKFEIGRRMRDICEARGIAHDIDMSEKSRIYGEAWYDFLGSCRATLGSESGSNCFDFDGSLASRYQELKAANGREPSYSEFRRYTDPLEGMVKMGQISPRVFEAAALGTPMVMFTGHYSDIVSPGEHYIELKKDFSNVGSVLEQLQDIGSLEAVAGRAHDHLIASGKYDYRRFVETVEAVIDHTRAEKARPQSLGLPLPAAWGEAFEPHSLIERPTPAPRDAAALLYKQAVRETALCRAEIARLNDVYKAEIAHLNHAYAAEIASLNEVIAESRGFRGLCLLSYRLARQLLGHVRARLSHLRFTLARL
ncbi:MAG: hypothetical protein JO282_09345 [Alphaproteobacteria bacterium]|nr:hypothetical protein [Alphaproteobacteria bacterium]